MKWFDAELYYALRHPDAFFPLFFFHRHARNTNACKHAGTGKWRPQKEETGEWGKKTQVILFCRSPQRYSDHFSCAETLVLRSRAPTLLEITIASWYPAALLGEALATHSTAGRKDHMPRPQHHPLQPIPLWTDSDLGLSFTPGWAAQQL